MIDKQGNDLDTDKVFLVKRSLVGFGWVCAPKHMTAEEVSRAVDEQCEAYLPDTPWTVCPREHEDETLCSPGRCDEHSGRQHWWLLGGITAAFIIANSEDGMKGISEDLVLRDSWEADGNA